MYVTTRYSPIAFVPSSENVSILRHFVVCQEILASHDLEKYDQRKQCLQNPVWIQNIFYVQSINFKIKKYIHSSFIISIGLYLLGNEVRGLIIKDRWDVVPYRRLLKHWRHLFGNILRRKQHDHWEMNLCFHGQRIFEY